MKNRIEACAQLIDGWFLVGKDYKDMNGASSTKWNMEHLHGEHIEFRIYQGYETIEIWGRRKTPNIGTSFEFKQQMDDLVDEVLNEHG